MRQISQNLKLEVLSPPYFQSFLRLNQQLDLFSDAAIHLVFEDTQHFDCSQCASCCNDFWHLEITQAYYEKWAAYWDNPPTQEIVQPFELLKEPTAQAYARLRKKPNSNECIFLMADKGCFIHKHFGFAAKPDGCQAYPHALKLSPNGYTVMFLLQSCQSSPALKLKYSQIFYQIKSQNQADFQKILPRSQLKHLPLKSHYLWLGWVLDLLENPALNSLEALREVHFPLLALLANPLENITETELVFAHQEHLKYLQNRGFPGCWPLQYRKTALGWFLTLAKYRFPNILNWLNEKLNGLALLPGLSHDDWILYDQFLKNYLKHKLVTQNYHETMLGEFNLFQHLLVLALQQLSLQFVLVYLKETMKLKTIDIHCIGRAVNWVERQLGHAPTWISGMGIPQLSANDCVQAYQMALSLDIRQLDFVTEDEN